MPAKVADASVIGAMVFEEPEAEQAEALLTGAELYEPPLLAYELASIARKKALLDPDRAEEVFQALRLALAIGMNWVDVDQVAVVRLSLETGLSTYDASYLYVARVMAAPLVTFDAKLERASKGLP
jgi:predicted nucleic acid-binding protein